MLKDSIEHHRNGRLPEAEAGYRAWLAEHPDDADALHLLGLLRQQLGDVDDARDLLGRAQAQAPDDPQVVLALATIAFGRGEFADATEGFRKVLGIDPNVSAARTGLGQLAQLEGRTAEAEEHFRVALRGGEDPQALAGLAGILFERGDRDGAMRHVTRAADLAPDDAAIQYALGRILIEHGATDAGERALRNALARAPQMPQAHRLLAERALSAGRAAEAETHYRALRAAPGYALAGTIGLADVARATGRFDLAIEGYRAALAMAPADPGIRRSLAWSLARTGRTDEALALYDGAADAPDTTGRQRERAEFLSVIGRSADAREAWRSVVADHPEDLDAQAKLAQIDEVQGRLEDADATAAMVLTARPDDVPMQFIRVRSLLRNGDFGDARARLERMANRRLDGFAMRQRWHYLGRALDGSGDAADAVKAFVEAQRGAPSSLPPLENPNPRLFEALSEPVAGAWPQAPVLLLGTPGSGVEAVAAMLADQPALMVLRDRTTPIHRADEFTNPRFAFYCGALTDRDRETLREDYADTLRALKVPPGRTIVDWLPRWDAHLLALLRRAMPGTRLVVVRRDARDALLNWLAFGGPFGMPCPEPDAAAEWLVRARNHLEFARDIGEPARVSVMADALFEDRPGARAELAAFLGLPGLVAGRQFAQAEEGLGGLPNRFPAGHWQAYDEVLGDPFRRLEAVLESAA